VRAGRAIGYLLGAPKPGTVWGTNVWVETAGQATSEPEVMRDLYALAATRWVDEGRTAQYVLAPASDAGLLDAWYRLAFGQQQAHALRPLATEPFPPPAKVTVRRARRADISALARLEVELPRHQGLAPTFSAGTVSTYEENLAEWESDFDNPTFTPFVAEVDGEVVGSAVGCAIEVSNSNAGLIRPDRAGFLAFAAVFPAARGLGAGRALGEAVITWAGDAGYDCVATDWRVTNLLSSRTWPRLGFAPAFLRLHRLLGH
jgi:GNAT superfamily N-acetyltransferase